jgi:T5orf172 domain
MNFIYVISANESGPCKIGISIDPNRRLKQLQTGHEEILFVHHTEPVIDAKLYEGLLHKTMNYKRKRGEWFNMSVKESIDYIKFILIKYQPSELIP